jgi:ribosomal protein S12 methylthiotransferase
MKKHRKICRYLDIPAQHADDKILKLMNRGHEAKEIYDIINFFRNEIPEISIRTTLITGFPGEGKKEFEKLKEFVIETKIDRLGVFNYSHEDKTPAWDKLRDTVPAKTKIQRSDELMKIQEQISFDKNYGKIGSTLRVIIDSKEGAFFIARSEFDSPEVDNEVLIPVENNDLKIGNFYDVKVFDALEFDLYARPV